MDLEGVIEELKPDIIAIGYDQDDLYRSLVEIIKDKNFMVDVVRIGRFGPTDLNSSSKIKRKVIEGWKKP
jgi:FAD synthetase